MRFAFDEQLFVDLADYGSLKYVNVPVARYLWHENSLSAGQRGDAIREAVGLRWRNSSLILRLLFLVPWLVMLLDAALPSKKYTRFLATKRWDHDS
jgi:hypothetical protein